MENVTEIEDLQKFFTDLNKQNSFLNFEKTLTNILDSKQIEKLTRIRDVELDNIANMFFWGVKHTSFMNKSKKFYYPTLNYNDLKISSMLEYILIHLSLRLSLDGKSRQEIENILTAMIKIEMDKLKTEHLKRSEQ